MDFESRDLRKLARLSRLAISDQEQRDVLPALTAILNWVGELSEAPTQGVAPMAHPHDMALRLRQDAAQSLPPREVLMQNAPQSAAGLFIVPKVVE